MAALVNLRILHASENVIVVEKPPGVPFHQQADQPGVLQLCRRQQQGGRLPGGPLFPVHRLDTITSGALVLARNREAAGLLARDFRARRVQKYYVALSERRPAKKMGSVVGDMKRGRRGSWLLSRTTTDPAITRFVSAAVAPDALPGSRQGLRAFLLKPETGRTHQLRVAMKSLGSPVLGDVRYSKADQARMEDRAYLACAAMRFPDPGGGKIVQVVCRPEFGKEFQTEGFRSLFDLWFPEDLASNKGVWFPESKLLRASVDSQWERPDPGLE